MKRSVILLFLTLLLTGCALSTAETTSLATTTGTTISSDLWTTTDLDYAVFDHLGGYDEIFDRSQATYIVYLYSLTCHNCAAIKQDVVAFATTHTLHQVYFLNVDQVDSEGRAEYLARTGQLSIGVPCLVLVSEQGTFDPEMTGQHLARGSAAVLELIALIEAGNVLNWN